MYLRQSLLLVSLFAVVLLTGCISAQTNIALYGEGQWSGVQAIQLAPEFSQMVEDMEEMADESGGEFTSEMNMEELDEWIAEAEAAAEGQGSVNVTFNQEIGEDGSQTFVLQADGQQFQTLNDLFFENQAEITVETVDGQRQITINYTISSDEFAAETESEAEMPEEMEEEMAQMMEMFGFSTLFQISGGEIISSNATRVEGNTAIWENPVQIEVTLTEAPEFVPESIAVQDMPASSGLFDALAESAIDSSNSAEPDDTPVENEDMVESPTKETVDSEAEIAEEETVSESTTTPAEETAPLEASVPDAGSSSLPQSGGILPESASGGALALAGLVLVSLVGGAITALRRGTTKTW